jgi:hypothetical protein
VFAGRAFASGYVDEGPPRAPPPGSVGPPSFGGYFPSTSTTPSTAPSGDPTSIGATSAVPALGQGQQPTYWPQAESSGKPAEPVKRVTAEVRLLC